MSGADKTKVVWWRALGPPSMATSPAGRGPATTLRYSAIALLALSIRLIIGRQLSQLPLYRTPQLDGHEYLTWAQAIAGGSFDWPSPPPHGPGYPLFLAAILKLGIPIWVAQSVLGAATCVLVAIWTERQFGRTAGMIAGALLAIYGPLVWLDGSILAESLLILLIAATLVARPALLVGLLLGFATIVRPTALIIAPLLFPRRMRDAVIIGVTTLAIIVPFFPIQSYGGLNFYLGNSPHRDGTASARRGGDWEKIEPRGEHFFAKTSSEIAAAPVAYFRLLGRKLLLTFSHTEIRDTHSYVFFRDRTLLRYLPGFAILFALAAMGFSRSRAVLYVLLLAVTCVFLVVGSRYRAPMVIGLAALAGNALSRRAYIAAVAALAVSVFVSHPPSRNVSEELALTGASLTREGRLPEAAQSYRAALEADPDNAAAHDGLGVVLAQKGDRIGAHASFQKAIALNPHFARAHADLGQLDGSRESYERALELDPRYAEVLQDYAKLEVRYGNLDHAAELYERFLALSPNDRNALIGAAQVEGARGNFRRAIELTRRALQIREDGPTFLLLATLAADAGDAAGADDALTSAQILLPRNEAFVFESAVVRYKQKRYEEAVALLREIPDSLRGQQLMNAIQSGVRRP